MRKRKSGGHAVAVALVLVASLERRIKIDVNDEGKLVAELWNCRHDL